MKQGDIYFVALDPVVGSEQAKTRPCVIVSTDMINDFGQTVTVAPLSTAKRKKPFLFHIPFEQGAIKLEHIRTVDKIRLQRRIGRVPLEILNRIKELLIIYFDI